MELGLPSGLHPWLHSKTSQYGRTQTMKNMMKVVTGKIESYESKKHEIQSLQIQIIKEMNNMEAFYRANKYSDNNPKPHLEKEVITLYNANKKRIANAGIDNSNLKEFIKNSDRKHQEDIKKIKDEIRREQAPPVYHDRMPVNSPPAEPSKSRENERAEAKPDWDDEQYSAYKRERNGINEFDSRYEYCV